MIQSISQLFVISFSFPPFLTGDAPGKKRYFSFFSCPWPNRTLMLSPHYISRYLHSFAHNYGGKKGRSRHNDLLGIFLTLRGGSIIRHYATITNTMWIDYSILFSHSKKSFQWTNPMVVPCSTLKPHHSSPNLAVIAARYICRERDSQRLGILAVDSTPIYDVWW